MSRRPPPRADRSWLLGTPFAAFLLAAFSEWSAPWAVRWFAFVPAPARIEEIRDGIPVVLVDTGAAEPVEALAHGVHTPGDPVDVTVRHVPSLPEAAVLSDHVSPWPFLVLAVLACLAVPAVWGPGGLRAAWNRRRRRSAPSRRRRRSRPDRDRDRGAALWRPVLARAVPALLCTVAGILLAVPGILRAAVGIGHLPDSAALAFLTCAWLLLPAGGFLAVRALLHYADRAPVRSVPAPARTLPARVSSALLVCALLVAGGGAAGGRAWHLYQGHRAMAATEAGTALVSEVWERDVRGGCQGEADLHYTVADLPYSTALDIPCEDVERVRAERFVDVEWSADRPGYVRWVR
ncbi:hypothetical protein [Nocardiopsis sp. CC223A]|uniref:hypothetical protein n=1 Tax=Nocardiopsis sp. CC223A TaxID=3044051 RepID=UPI00278BBB5C|nr:hypothetical protein [Nocardiopsis sp. CC223A]